jgi:CBS domain-containing protein
MAQNALQCQPPIGLLRAFVLDRDKAHRDTIDLKMSGSRPYVDAARLFALSNGIAATGTADRLRAASRHASFGKEDLQAVIDGFHFVQMLRLRSQLRSGAAENGLNRINPYQLNSMDRSVLRHALRQAQRLQQRLKADHRL